MLGSSICRNSQKLEAKVVPLPPVNPITPTDFYSPWRLEKSGIHCSYSTTKFCCSHLILAYTVRLAIINAAELERNGCFSLSLSTKSLQIELVTKYDTNDFFKESLVGVGGGGVQIYEGCPYPPVDLDGADPDLDRGPNPRRVQIKSAATPEQLRTFIPSPKRNLQAYIASSKSDKISQKFFYRLKSKFFFAVLPQNRLHSILSYIIPF